MDEIKLQTNDANTPDIQPLTDTQNIDPPIDHSAPKTKIYISGFIISLSIVVVSILAVVGYVTFETAPSHSNICDQPVLSKQTDSRALEQDERCILVTPQSYLDQLPDDIVQLCRPHKIDAEGSRHNLIECGIGSSKYIHSFCLCDKNITCSENRFDSYKRQKCIDCKTKYCPCQNEGVCNNCSSEIELISCSCLPGSTGTYCTKISERLCSLTKQNASAFRHTNCANSNNKSCVTKEYSRELFCTWSGSMGNYPTCSEEVVSKIGLPGNPQSQGIREENYTKSTSSTSKTIFLVILILCIVNACALVFLTFTLRKTICKFAKR